MSRNTNPLKEPSILPNLSIKQPLTRIIYVRGIVPCAHKSSNLILSTAYSSFPAPQTLSTFPTL